ncbi:MAG TPA: hypothetical protein VMF13_07660 [Luteitalea sp.]|nr:hypothetical protein [Luteitalea sp.]
MRSLKPLARRSLLALVLIAGSTVPAMGQATPRIEVIVLGGLVGGGDLGDRKADALGNQAPTSPPATWFSTSARIDAAPAIEGRVGVRAFGGFWVEGGVNYSRPEFVVDISQDVEGAPDTTATSQLTEVLVDGSLQYRFKGRRLSPFVLAGAGYLRQLDDTRATAETGWLAQAGGGVVVRLAPGSRGFARRIALRADVRVVWLRDGVVLEKQRGPGVSALAGVSIGL